MFVRVVALMWGMGCGNPAYPPTLPLEHELTGPCETAADCAVVELGCCDACNGGTAVAVRADRVAETRDRYEERPCDNIDCTLMACPAPQAVCEIDPAADPQSVCALAPGVPL